MKISIIVAVSENNIIGKDNTLIWHLPADMKYFKEKTTGHCIITGRKNYESIPEKFRPLPNRTNFIVTRQKDYLASGAIICGSIEEAIKKASELGEIEVFIIGGAEIYKQCIHLTDKLYVTKIHHTFDGDVSFPQIDPNIWKKITNITFQADDKNKYAYTFFEYEKIVKFE